MTAYEYEVTRHGAEEFKQMAYFCSEKGECRLDEVPQDQLQRLEQVLNERGALGWELVQILFREGGAVAFWKRREWDKNFSIKQ